ncbi:MAG: hypothetical protein ACI8RD_002489, partial [Bacillariaceae sp.]
KHIQSRVIILQATTLAMLLHYSLSVDLPDFSFKKARGY